MLFGLISLVAACACFAIACRISTDAQVASNRQVIRLVFDDGPLARTIYQHMVATFDRYAIKERYGLSTEMVVVAAVDGVPMTSTELSAVFSGRPSFIVAPNHYIAESVASSPSRPQGTTVIFGTRRDPRSVGLVDHQNRQQRGTTGTLITAPFDDAIRASLLKEWWPTATRVGVLLDGYRDAKERAVTLRQVEIDSRFEVISAVATDASTLRAAVLAFSAARVDAILISEGDIAFENMDYLAHLLRPMKIPVVAVDRQFCRALAAICAHSRHGNDFDRWADAVIQVMSGIPAESIPIALPHDVDISINPLIALSVGRKLPKALMLRSTYSFSRDWASFAASDYFVAR